MSQVKGVQSVEAGLLLSEFAFIPGSVDLSWLIPSILFLITPFYGLTFFMNDFNFLVFTFPFSVLFCVGGDGH
ncbi:hypothetical protein [Alkalihalobacillus pseudalcaliphilus]|uniref:hypothetical protein n=1 Tax=Alkalihalobacillus pseudalcaliphilus TaxID=79884 RepID=UPI000B316A0C|nr:hypothetical protein [Alkalihalobacillus pseudalcaliphilus]